MSINRPLYRARLQVGRAHHWAVLTFPARDVALNQLLRQVKRVVFDEREHSFTIPLIEDNWPLLEDALLRCGFALDDELRERIAARRKAREEAERAERKAKVKGGKA